METEKQEYWCTLKEYQRIKPWTWEFTLRQLRGRIKKGNWEEPTKKVLHKSGAYSVYLVNITDPRDIIALCALRKNKEYKKAGLLEAACKAPDPLCNLVDRDSETQKRTYRRKISVPAGSLMDIVMQSKEHREFIMYQIKTLAEKTSQQTNIEQSAIKKNHYNVTMGTEIDEYLNRCSREKGLPAATIFVSLFTEFMDIHMSVVESAVKKVMQNRAKERIARQSEASDSPQQ